MSLVSIIIPNYNHAPYLKQRIDSVLAQTYTEFEVILLDDCSKDNSRDVIATYQGHPKVAHIVYNEQNSGSVFKQWEKGIHLARGKYVWIAESDDWAHPDFLSVLVPVLESNTKLAFAYCDAEIVLDSEARRETFADRKAVFFGTDKWRTPYTNSGKEEIKEVLLRQCTVNNASSVLFQKDALLAVNPFDVVYRYVGDWYCYLKLCAKYEIAYTPQVLNYYREHAQNASRQLSANLSFVEEYFKLFKWVKQHLPFIPKRTITKLLSIYGRHAMFSNRSHGFPMYKRLFRLDPTLFISFMNSNIRSAIHERFRKP